MKTVTQWFLTIAPFVRKLNKFSFDVVTYTFITLMFLLSHEVFVWYIHFCHYQVFLYLLF